MSASIEALAMAGMDYHVFGMTKEEWEREELELPPPHLLAEEEGEVERSDGKHRFSICGCGLLNSAAKHGGVRRDVAVTKNP